MRVLITGGSGLLGNALQQSIPVGTQGFSTSLSVPTLPSCRIDVVDREQMQSLFELVRPDIVIHTAAIGSVDFAERNREQTRKVNVGGTEVVVELCHRFKSRLIYISSNAVFDGCNPLYSEPAPVNPINYYGQLKVEAENIVGGSDLSWAVIRPILMYGWPGRGGRDNLVTRWVRSLEDGKPVNVVDNVFSKPLPAWSCAEVIWEVIRRGRTGIYHVAGKDHLSLYQVAIQVAEVFELDERLITPVPNSYFPDIAPRPRDTSFETEKMEKDLGVKPVGVKEGLIRMRDLR